MKNLRKVLRNIMAIYEYQCPKCKEKAEKIISLSSFKINGFAVINGYSLANK
jgi:Zn finger protein HypA/HybF involved in hydrogenase expression